MKINNMFFVYLILLAILSIGAVSASDNITFSDDNFLSDFEDEDFDDWQDDDAYQMDINVEDNYVYYEDDLSLVNLTLPNDANGNLAVYEGSPGDGGYYLCEFPLSDGQVEVKLSQIHFDNDCLVGFHDLIFIYDCDDYDVNNGELFLHIVDYKVSGPKYINLGENVTYLLDLNRDISGKLYVQSMYENADGDMLDDDAFYFDIIDGMAEVTFNNLKMGTYYYYFDFADEDLFIQREIVLYVLPKIIVKNKVIIGVDDILDVDLPDDAEGSFLISLYSHVIDDYIDISASYDGGKIKLSSIGLLAGEYDILNFEINDFDYGSISFDQTPMFESNHGVYATFKAVNPTAVVVTASNLKTVYTDGGMYKVKVAINGKAAKGAIVVFKINGVIVKTTSTDKNGYASLKITNTPGNYKITAVTLGKTITKTLTVKHLLTLNTVTVKKSAKKLVLTASLAKVNGKYLKNKKITFKFKGTTYTKFTDSKGIAKVTIKSNILNKLSLAKQITYQATYMKDTVKKTAKVSK